MPSVRQDRAWRAATRLPKEASRLGCGLERASLWSMATVFGLESWAAWLTFLRMVLASSDASGLSQSAAGMSSDSVEVSFYEDNESKFWNQTGNVHVHQYAIHLQMLHYVWKWLHPNTEVDWSDWISSLTPPQEPRVSLIEGNVVLRTSRNR